MRDYYIIDYTLETENGLVEFYHFEGETVFEGFKEMKVKAEELNATIYRKYSRIQSFDEQIFNGVMFTSSER